MHPFSGDMKFLYAGERLLVPPHFSTIAGDILRLPRRSHRLFYTKGIFSKARLYFLNLS